MSSYWYVVNGRVVAAEYQAKLYSAWDAIVHGRNNGAVIVVRRQSAGRRISRGGPARLHDFVTGFVPVSREYAPALNSRESSPACNYDNVIHWTESSEPPGLSVSDWPTPKALNHSIWANTTGTSSLSRLVWPLHLICSSSCGVLGFNAWRLMPEADPLKKTTSPLSVSPECSGLVMASMFAGSRRDRCHRPDLAINLQLQRLESNYGLG